MLVEGIVTTDIQPLYSLSTGDVVLIDMTEAVIIDNDGVDDDIDGGGYGVNKNNNNNNNMESTTTPTTGAIMMSDIDIALINGFCTEMINLIPSKYLDIAAESFSCEMMNRIDQRKGGGQEIVSIAASDSSRSSSSSSSSAHHYHRSTIVDNNDVKEILKGLPITTGPLLDYLNSK
jgi:hypothetical protein